MYNNTQSPKIEVLYCTLLFFSFTISVLILQAMGLLLTWTVRMISFFFHSKEHVSCNHLAKRYNWLLTPLLLCSSSLPICSSWHILTINFLSSGFSWIQYARQGAHISGPFYTSHATSSIQWRVSWSLWSYFDIRWSREFRVCIIISYTYKNYVYI
jgi:hypothetical protein